MADGGFLFHHGTRGGAVVLLPGFATDGRIFGELAGAWDRISPANGAVYGFTDRLAAYLRSRGCGPVTVLGWSLGGFLGAAFAKACPDLVRHLVLVGVRRRYRPDEIGRFRRSLEEDRTSCLTEFYARCFLPDLRREYKAFRAGLMPRYLREMGARTLLEGLAYLAAAELGADSLPPCPITFVHGERDVVAPLTEVEALAARAPNAELRVIPRTPHAAFLSEAFPPILEDCLR